MKKFNTNVFIVHTSAMSIGSLIATSIGLFAGLPIVNLAIIGIVVMVLNVIFGIFTSYKTLVTDKD